MNNYKQTNWLNMDRDREGGKERGVEGRTEGLQIDLSKLHCIQNCLVHVILKFFYSFDPVSLPQLNGHRGPNIQFMKATIKIYEKFAHNMWLCLKR